MKILTFDEWLEENADLLDRDFRKKVTCRTCEGSGEGSCPTCGNDTYECDACDGTGKVAGEVARGQHKEMLFKQYKELAEKQTAQYEQWLKIIKAECAPAA